MSMGYYLPMSEDTLPDTDDADIYGGLISGGYESFLGGLNVVSDSDDESTSDTDSENVTYGGKTKGKKVPAVLDDPDMIEELAAKKLTDEESEDISEEILNLDQDAGDMDNPDNKAEDKIEFGVEDNSEDTPKDKVEFGVEEPEDAEDTPEDTPVDKVEFGVEDNSEDKSENKAEDKPEDKVEFGVEDNPEDKPEDKSEDKVEFGVEDEPGDNLEDKPEGKPNKTKNKDKKSGGDEEIAGGFGEALSAYCETEL